MLAKEILKGKSSSVITARPDEKVWSVLRRFQTHGVGALVITDDQGHLVGLLSERDLVIGMATRGKHLFDVEVREVMSKQVPTCRPGESVVQIMQAMTDRRSRQLPVIDEEDRLIGIISLGDVVKARLEDVDLENKVLRDMTRVHE